VPVETRLTAAAGPLPEAVLTAEAEVLAVPVGAGPELSAAEIADLLPVSAGELLDFYGAKGEPGEITAVPVRLGGQARELLLYGVGDGSPRALRRAGAALARRGRGREALVASVPDGDLAAFAEGVLLASYDFKIGEPLSGKRAALGAMHIITEESTALERGAVIAHSTALARDLANMPSLEKSPAWLAEQAQKLATDTGLAVRVRDEQDLSAEGFGGLLAVGSGSARPPRLIELTYDPGMSFHDDAPALPEITKHVVLVGKGITFDSGGLSLKPNDSMKTMKTDMAGGAVVIAVMGALRALGVGVRVTGLIAAAENMPSGTAMRPQDVIRHYGGKTSEVLNTDAEGRLVLADALAYADLVLEPDVVVDIATLTGAAKIALGLKHGALFATEDGLAAALTKAAEGSGEALWRLPLVDEYRPSIDSDVADVANIGRLGFGAGSITAALFLREFTGGRPWAHLDVAGPARAAADDGEITKGATGFGTRLLLNWLTTQ
jgi:leucyl aminopeptidase